MQRDDATLLKIAKAARLVSTFIAEMTKDAFLDDIKTESSVLYQLIVIGEAVKRLSQEFRAQHSDVPWSLIAGMRDHLIHLAFSVWKHWNPRWRRRRINSTAQRAGNRLKPIARNPIYWVPTFARWTISSPDGGAGGFGIFD